MIADYNADVIVPGVHQVRQRVDGRDADLAERARASAPPVAVLVLNGLHKQVHRDLLMLAHGLTDPRLRRVVQHAHRACGLPEPVVRPHPCHSQRGALLHPTGLLFEGLQELLLLNQAAGGLKLLNG